MPMQVGQKRERDVITAAFECFCLLLLCGQKIIGKRSVVRSTEGMETVKRGLLCASVVAEASGVMHVEGLGQSERLLQPHMGTLGFRSAETCKELKRKRPLNHEKNNFSV